eukprot:448916-Rhodomonas_salina.2
MPDGCVVQQAAGERHVQHPPQARQAQPPPLPPVQASEQRGCVSRGRAAGRQLTRRGGQVGLMLSLECCARGRAWKLNGAPQPSLLPSFPPSLRPSVPPSLLPSFPPSLSPSVCLSVSRCGCLTKEDGEGRRGREVVPHVVGAGAAGAH